MGKGDKRTQKGKIFKHSFGKSRPKKKNEGKQTTTTAITPTSS